MELMSGNLEYRGLSKKTTKSGEVVFNANFEDEYNDPIQLYVGKDPHKFQNLVKGDIVDLLLEYNFNYKVLKIIDVSVVKVVEKELDDAGMLFQ